MLAGLDPHSGYMNPHSLRDMQVQSRGEFGGLGIEVTIGKYLDSGQCSRRANRQNACLRGEG